MLHSSSYAALLCLCCIYFDYVVIKNHMYWQPSSSLQGPSGPVACCWPLRGQRLIFKDISMLHLSFLLFYFDHVVTKNHIDWPNLIFKHNSELYYSDCVVYLFIMKPLRPSGRPAGLGQANTRRFKRGLALRILLLYCRRPGGPQKLGCSMVTLEGVRMGGASRFGFCYSTAGGLVGLRN